MAKAQTNAESHLKQEAIKIGKQVREKLDQAANKVMDAFYSDYTPTSYERTENLKNAHRSRNVIEEFGPSFIDHVSVTFSPEYMSTYNHGRGKIIKDGGLGHLEFEQVNPAIVFELDFMQGYHGGPTWFIGRKWLKRDATDLANSDIGAWMGNFRANAERMTPSPYELMETEYKEIVRQTDIWSKSDALRARVNAAIDADIRETLAKIQSATGGK